MDDDDWASETNDKLEPELEVLIELLGIGNDNEETKETGSNELELEELLDKTKLGFELVVVEDEIDELEALPRPGIESAPGIYLVRS